MGTTLRGCAFYLRGDRFYLVRNRDDRVVVVHLVDEFGADTIGLGSQRIVHDAVDGLEEQGRTLGEFLVDLHSVHGSHKESADNRHVGIVAHLSLEPVAEVGIVLLTERDLRLSRLGIAILLALGEVAEEFGIVRLHILAHLGRDTVGKHGEIAIHHGIAGTADMALELVVHHVEGAIGEVGIALLSQSGSLRSRQVLHIGEIDDRHILDISLADGEASDGACIATEGIGRDVVESVAGLAIEVALARGGVLGTHDMHMAGEEGSEPCIDEVLLELLEGWVGEFVAAVSHVVAIDHGLVVEVLHYLMVSDTDGIASVGNGLGSRFLCPSEGGSVDAAGRLMSGRVILRTMDTDESGAGIDIDEVTETVGCHFLGIGIAAFGIERSELLRRDRTGDHVCIRLCVGFVDIVVSRDNDYANTGRDEDVELACYVAMADTISVEGQVARDNEQVRLGSLDGVDGLVEDELAILREVGLRGEVLLSSEERGMKNVRVREDHRFQFGCPGADGATEA